jgi:predicted N-acyltransferase
MDAELTLSLHGSISEIAVADWQACAGDGNPFASHAFLSAVEDSGSANARTGWLPQHAQLKTAAGEVVAVAPMYAKSHSYGEYVFDHGWANAFERAGGKYYPKLLVGVPFSPVPGPRLLIRPGSGVPMATLAGALAQANSELDMSGVHVTFCQRDEYDALGQAGWLQRLGMQFHWQNNNYADFDGFLAALSSTLTPPGWNSSPCAEATSPTAIGTRSTAFTNRPSIANGAAPTSPAVSSPYSANDWATRWCS